MSDISPELLGAKCHLCPLGKCGAAGPVLPESHEHAWMAVVGDYPEDREIVEGRPFTGQDSHALTRALAQAGVKRESVHWTTAVLCQPPANDMKKLLAKIQSRNSEIKKENTVRAKENLPPIPLELSPQECCRPRLAAELQGFKNIITLGGTACKAVTGATASILDLRGGTMHGPLLWDSERNTLRLLKNDSIHADPDPDAIKLLPTVSTSFIRFAKKWTQPFITDIGRAVRWFQDRLNWTAPEIVYQPDPETVREFLKQAYLAYDLETDGIEPTVAKIRCIGIGNSEKVMMIGFLSKDHVTRFYEPMTELRMLAVVRDWFMDDQRVKVSHNGGSYDRLCVRHQWRQMARAIADMLHDSPDCLAEALTLFPDIFEDPEYPKGAVDPWPNLDTILLHRLVASELPHRLGFVGSMYVDSPSWKMDRDGRKLAFDSENDAQLHEYCLYAGTPVVLADGTTDTINHIVAHKRDVSVLSMGKNGLLEPKKIIGWHRSRVKDQTWVAIKTTTGGAKGDLRRGMVLTPDHKVYTHRGLIRADHVVSGDYVAFHKRALYPAEKSMLLGSLLGDSYIDVSKKHRQAFASAPVASLVGGHNVKSGLAQAKAGVLDILTLRSTYENSVFEGYVSDDMQPYGTPFLPEIADLVPLVYDENNKRRIKKETLDSLGPIGLAWWFMDDGCQMRTGGVSNRMGIQLSTQGFPMEDIELAADWFREKYGPVSINKPGVLRISGSASDKIYAQIAPYVFPCCRYKLPTDVDGKFPYKGYPKRPAKVSYVLVESVSDYVPRKTTTNEIIRSETRYCITVEDNHNFFTSFGLVQNCGLDTAITYNVMPTLWDAVHVKDQQELIVNDHEIQELCVHMHEVGMFVDQPKRAKFEQKKVLELVKYKEQLRSFSGLPLLNPGSIHQLRKLLFKDWKLQPVLDDKLKYTLAGDPSTSDDAIRACLAIPGLREEQKGFLKTIRNYRSVQKELGTYIAKLRPRSESIEGIGWDVDSLIDENSIASEEGKKSFIELSDELFADKEYGRKGITWEDGRMRPGYNAHVAVTGRLSSSKPINAQNFSKVMRALIRAQPGHILVGADADQLELRIAAARWKCPLYLSAFEADADPHSMTGIACFGDQYINADGWPEGDKIYTGGVWVPRNGSKFKSGSQAERLRKLAKIVQYLSQYGGSPEAGLNALQQTEDENGELIYLLFQLRQYRLMHEAWLKGAKEFPIGWQKEMAFFRKHGYSQEPVMGRKRDHLDGEDANEIYNFSIQGSASSLMNRAMRKIQNEIPLHKWGHGTGIITMTHDALVVECPDDGVELIEVRGKKTFVAKPGSTAAWVSEVIEDAMNQTDPSLPGVKFTAAADIAMTWDKVG